MKDFKELFERQGALKNCEGRTHFHEPLRTFQVKGKRVAIHVLPKVEETIQELLRYGHTVNLGKCTEDCFILPTVLTTKRDGLVKLALNSKLVNKQFYRNR